jgi:hypothetical protein
MIQSIRQNQAQNSSVKLQNIVHPEAPSPPPLPQESPPTAVPSTVNIAPAPSFSLGEKLDFSENLAQKAMVQDLNQQLKDLATSPEQFKAVFQQAFPGLSDEKIAAVFEQVKTGNIPVPEIRFMDPDALQAQGAFLSEGEGMIVLNRDLLQAPDQLQATFAEEMGHYFDFQLNAQDSPGDEGRRFAQALAKGSPLSPDELSRSGASRNDHGVVMVDGKPQPAEFKLLHAPVPPAVKLDLKSQQLITQVLAPLHLNAATQSDVRLGLSYRLSLMNERERVRALEQIQFLQAQNPRGVRAGNQGERMGVLQPKEVAKDLIMKLADPYAAQQSDTNHCASVSAEIYLLSDAPEKYIDIVTKLTMNGQATLPSGVQVKANFGSYAPNKPVSQFARGYASTLFQDSLQAHYSGSGAGYDARNASDNKRGLKRMEYLHMYQDLFPGADYGNDTGANASKFPLIEASLAKGQPVAMVTKDHMMLITGMVRAPNGEVSYMVANAGGRSLFSKASILDEAKSFLIGGNVRAGQSPSASVTDLTKSYRTEMYPE